MLLGGIEAGGTKLVCAIAEISGKTVCGKSETGQVRNISAAADKAALLKKDKETTITGTPVLVDKMTIPTETPEVSMPRMLAYFKKFPIQVLGIASFGPLDLCPQSPAYGQIMKTPKSGWPHIDLVTPFKEILQVPVGLDTDVNGAVLGEVRYGAARDCDTVLYITIGTGIGVGVHANGGLLHGLVHPEAGHMMLARHPHDDFDGSCPFHGRKGAPFCCFEGLASGPALQARWGKPAEQLSEDKSVWELEAWYIAQAVTNLILCYSPEKVILGGGVMHQKTLYPSIRKLVKDNLNGYVQHKTILQQIEKLIVPPGLGEDSGIMGAIELGRSCLYNQWDRAYL